MGQKLDRLSEKDEESHDNSDWSEQTAETTEHYESRDQDDASFEISRGTGEISGISVGCLATGHAGLLTVTSAHTDPQTGQPIRPLGQWETPRDTRAEWVGGDAEARSVTRTAEGSETSLNPKETRHTLNKKQGFESKAVAFTGNTAMEERENGKKSEFSCSNLDPDTQTRNLTAFCDQIYEEDFVLVESNETWVSDRENNIFGNRINTENPQSSARRGAEEDASASFNLRPSSTNTSRENGNENENGGISDALLEAHAESLAAARFERETGQHFPEVTGSRCRLKEVNHSEAAHTEMTRGELAKREQNMNDHSKISHFTKEHPSTQNNSGSVKRLGDSPADLENVHETAVQFILQGEEGEETAVKSNCGSCSETADFSSRESQNEDEESYNSGYTEQKFNVDPSHQSRFAGAVYRRAKAGVTAAPGSNSIKKDDQEFCKVADNSSILLEQCKSIPLKGNEGCDGKTQIASLKRESEFVCFSAVITPPPLTHLLPTKHTSLATQLDTSMVNSQMVPDTNPCDSKDESTQKEKPKVKGPPPPVPKKPKNPFIKLKKAQLMSTEVQKRGKDHLHSDEKVRRRHTFHFNKILPCNPPTNQDMCLLWDERGTYAAPTNARRLSVGLSPWERLSLGHMDSQYGDMIDFEYCERLANVSTDEVPQNLDMLHRRAFLEGRSRYKSSPPPVAKKPSNAFAPTETLHTHEVTSDKEIQTATPACSKKQEIYHELCSEKASTQVLNDKHANCKDTANHTRIKYAQTSTDVGSFKPVAEIIKETNRMQRHQGHVKSEGARAQVRVTEESTSVKVSQIKNTFDVPKKTKDRPAELQTSPKKGKAVILHDLEQYSGM